ncbi:hypothetical protein QZK29_09820 [Acinetobacter baumannii]|nr:hypothetical protein [Acinetobacter baumannii]
MTDYIIAITGLIKMTSSLSIWSSIFYLLAVILCILAWKLPEIIKAVKDKDDD